jgi:hypothetical protein
MAEDPVNTNAVNFATAMARLAPSAAMIAFVPPCVLKSGSSTSAP